MAYARGVMAVGSVCLETRSRVARQPAGFTLLELMLVMAVLLVAAAITVPVIDSMMTTGNVKAARDMVRARWADIRGRAMKEGRPWKFSVIYQTGQFKIEPEDPNEPSDSSDDLATGSSDRTGEGELPPKVLFAKDQGSVGVSGGGGNYETLVVYLADGTARDDVQVLFGTAGSQPIGLQLRALTGAVSMVDPPQGNRP
jgi:prepilin-type N-terminal cleavage/methylation domain-containing protein